MCHLILYNPLPCHETLPYCLPPSKLVRDPCIYFYNFTNKIIFPLNHNQIPNFSCENY
uniref:Uncharacterized protein n=1 Tax=Siphoviridae sp. ct87j35 TaxID=2825356 RepID=A0A8S5V4W0_9CAUD|nr:MAG TPA: hypothetical protein [Siphoviridae sp. ct87j35]